MNIFDTIRDNRLTPTEVSEDDYYYALGVLPPIYAKGCFGMGECHHGNSYYWFASKGDKYFAVLGERPEAERALEVTK